MTRQGFLKIYEVMLRERTTWAKDAERLARFMASVTSAWKAAGGKGRPTYKALNALTA